jgi:septin family protein
MGSNRQLRLLPKPSHTVAPKIASMGSQQSRPQTSKIQFRVLIIGRANAGKTTILQRVCETTESPIIYRGKEQVRGPNDLPWNLISLRPG